MRNKKEITLIALILTIIVLLILAGVSLNALLGYNGLITNAQVASLKTKYANYKEELEMNVVGDITNEEDKVDLNRPKITTLQAEEEILANCTTTIAAHNILEKGGTVQTGGDTDGESLDNINN